MYLRFLMPFLCFASPFFLVAQKPDDVLMKVGNTPVTVSEFRYIYEKNNGSSADYTEKNLNEYLDLYTKFKLKVEKARGMKLDTISELKTELAGYRKQLAASYLIDKEVTDELLKELYERMKTDIEFSHIFIPVAENASLQTKEEARMKLKDIKTKLQKGQDFAKVATEFSEDKNSAPSGGYMGFFTAKMPTGFYNLESALYQTPIGSISDLVESKIGLHLIKVTNKRPARGQVEVAHLLLKADQKSIADSLYNLIKSGANFEDLVSRYSTDKNSSRNKGLLPPFGINTYDKNFEDAGFDLKSDGDISEPVLTRSGWHIIRRIAKPTPDSYEIFVKKMKAQINKDQRFDVAKVKLIADIKKSGGFVAYPEKLKAFASGLNEEFYSYRWNQDIQNPNDVLFVFGNNKSYTLKDFAEYCKKNTRTRLKYDKSKPISEIVDELYNDYTNELALEYEEQNLDKKYPDFRSLMREYEEGILLFEATKISVWDKANQDTIGLTKFFEANGQKYRWDEKVLVDRFNVISTDKKLIGNIVKFAEKNSGEAVLKKFNSKGVIVEFATTEHERKAKELMGVEVKQNAVSAISFNEKDTQFAKVVKIIPSHNKTLSEARGYVVADYQDYLERQWIEQLRKEFPVQINKDVFTQLKKS